LVDSLIGRLFGGITIGPLSYFSMPTRDPVGLPSVGGEFVGRERELERVGALAMGPARLVTLVGPGGIGKTRLAEETARRLHKARHTPAFAVRLARLPKGADADAVREAVTAAVLTGGFVGASAWDGAVQQLSPVDGAGRPVDTVLVVDNCEHVLPGAGAVIADLLDAVPGLTVLATSREPVGCIDEQLVTVPPLSARESLELFRQRAELAEHPVAGSEQVKLAQQICQRMHGHPLYIRLAAARMFYEPLPIILKQLSGESGDARMRWRHGPRVGSEGRHRAIGDVIAWSYELCTDKQRLLFDRLSAFAPGYDVNPDDAGVGVADVGAQLEAIEAVCADDVPIPGCDAGPGAERSDQNAVRLARSEIRELLERLVEQSLVSAHTSGGTVHYFLLESLRLFAADQLAERSTEQVDEPARLARRHCYHYRDKVVQAQAEWFGPAERELLTWAAGEWSNIRRATDTSMAAGEPVVGLQICVGLLALRAAFSTGSLPEIRARIEQTLAASQPQTAELQLGATALLAWLALVQGRPQDAEELLERCVAACGAAAARGGHWRDRPETDIGLPAVVELAWGVELMHHRDPRAIAVLARAREKFRSIGYHGGEAMAEMHEALAAGFLGSAEQAMSICQRHLERTTAAGAAGATAWAQLALAITLTKHGDAQEALQLVGASLASQVAVADQWSPTWAVHIRIWALARLITDQIAAANTNRPMLVKLATEIAYLAGGLKTQQARLGVLIENMGVWGDETGPAEQVARDVLGQQTYADAESRGLRLSPERFEVQRIALGESSVALSSPTEKTASSWQTLSKAEQDVAMLAAAGWPNSAIGVRRGTTTKTTDAQISSIFQKLMINSREDIARFVPPDLRNRISAEHSHIPHQSRAKPRPIRPRSQS
jgi:predicted ATPase/DNA-binding CsgD family transcriptional regulator